MEIKYSDAAAQTLRMKSQMAEALAAKSSQADRQIQLSTRQVRRLRARQAARQQKKATRTYVRRQWAADREEQNLLGVARVHFGQVVVPPAVFENVENHVAGVEEAVATELAAPRLAELDDWLSAGEIQPVDYLDKSSDVTYEAVGEAAKKVSDRLHDVLEKAHTEAVATAEDMTYADTRGRTFVSVVKG